MKPSSSHTRVFGSNFQSLILRRPYSNFHWRVPLFLLCLYYSTLFCALQLTNCKKLTIIFCLFRRNCAQSQIPSLQSKRKCVIIKMLGAIKPRSLTDLGFFFFPFCQCILRYYTVYKKQHPRSRVLYAFISDDLLITRSLFPPPSFSQAYRIPRRKRSSNPRPRRAYRDRICSRSAQPRRSFRPQGPQASLPP